MVIRVKNMGQAQKLDYSHTDSIPTIIITVKERCGYCAKILAYDSLVYGRYNAAKKIGHHLLCFSRANKFASPNEELVRFRLGKVR